jgi:carboxyl-terminal processing protease
VEHQYRFFKTQASFRNEKKYAGMDYPAAEYRLLTLFRYWNMIHYFSPFKYALMQDWNQVLADMMPVFRQAPDVTGFHLVIMELVARVNDSHVWFATRYTWQGFGIYTVPFQFKIVDKKAIITGANNDSLMQLSGLRRGDVITGMEGKSIADVLQPRWTYIVASHQAARLRKAGSAFLPDNIFNGSFKTVAIAYERDDQVQEAIINRYLPGQLSQKNKNQRTPRPLLNEQTAYVDMRVVLRR